MWRAALIEFDHDCSEHDPCRGTKTWVAQSRGVIVFDDSDEEPTERALLVKVFVGVKDVIRAFPVNGSEGDGRLVYPSKGQMFVCGATHPLTRNRYRVVEADLHIHQTLLEGVIRRGAHNVYLEAVDRVLLTKPRYTPQ